MGLAHWQTLYALRPSPERVVGKYVVAPSDVVTDSMAFSATGPTFTDDCAYQPLPRLHNAMQ